jgi:transposase
VTWEALVVQQNCFILATNEFGDGKLRREAVIEGHQGQQHAERSFRFLIDPVFLASSLYLKKPKRIMALLMVMTVCLWCMRRWSIAAARLGLSLLYGASPAAHP